MKTTSKIIKGRELQDFDISQGSLYIMRNTDVVVMASQEKEKFKTFSGVIVSGNLNGWLTFLRYISGFLFNIYTKIIYEDERQ